jgi:hypothetical protein
MTTFALQILSNNARLKIRILTTLVFFYPRLTYAEKINFIFDASDRRVLGGVKNLKEAYLRCIY